MMIEQFLAQSSTLYINLMTQYYRYHVIDQLHNHQKQFIYNIPQQSIIYLNNYNIPLKLQQAKQMLNLKKTNLQQKNSSSIETEQQTHFTEQSQFTSNINKLINKQKPYSHLPLLELLGESTSISGEQFVKILAAATNTSSLTNDSDLDNCLKILQRLITISHSEAEVKSALKKEKHIDAILLLSLLWQVRQNQAVWSYVPYMIECYPAEMILTGKQAVQKWSQYFDECQEKVRVNEQVKRRIAEFELKQKLRKQVVQNKKEKGFTDSYINL